MPRFPLVPLGELITYAPDPHEVDPDSKYPIAGVYGFGRGMIQRAAVAGGEIAAAQLFRIRAGQFIYSRLKSFEGAYSIVSPEVDGYFVSNEFPTFDIDRERIEPAFLGWYFKQHCVWQQLASDGRGIGARRERLHPKRLFDHAIPVPTLEEQRRVIARLELAAAAVANRKVGTDAAETEISATLRAAFARIISDAPRARMGDVAPLIRRPVDIDPYAKYPELGVRSFGKGTFHKAPLAGIDVGTKKLFYVAAGDLLFNIVFAWEGAVAVAAESDAGRVGSHRFLTRVVDPDRSTADFLRYWFLSEEGLLALNRASPGGAGRNRTLGIKALEAIQVPTPSLDAQQWFDDVQARARAARRAQANAAADLDRLLPAMLHEVFGE